MFGIDPAFDAYAFHTSECDRIVQEIAEGKTQIDYSQDLDESDYAYIARRLNEEYGMIVDFN